MKKTALCLVIVLCLSFFTACGKSEPVYTAEDVVERVYTYEKEGFGGPFRIWIYKDGSFQYYVGLLSSYIGIGKWTVEKGTLILSDNGFKNRFLIGEDMLTFLEEDSTGVMYLKMEDGDRFFGELIPQLPTLEEIKDLIDKEKATEEDLEQLLQGFGNSEMIRQWGQFDGMTSGLWSYSWELDETRSIAVYFDSDGYASEVRLWTKD